MEKTLEIVLETLEQVALEMESLRAEMNENKKNYNDLQHRLLETSCATAESAKYDMPKHNNLGTIATLLSEDQKMSVCSTCENAKLTAKDRDSPVIFECLASVKTDEMQLACNKYAPAMNREEQ